MFSNQARPPPRPHCIAEGWTSLSCRWPPPDNPVPTQYNIHFISRGSTRIFPCPDQEQLLALDPTHQYSPTSCYLNHRTAGYRQVAPTYTFLLNVANSLAPAGKVFKYKLDHFAVVQPRLVFREFAR